ncbi:MAG TPA: gamma-glutamylcyclotransferase family protein, partial [Methylovirgula sp.]|nr:gamma-glutamylcyclotransferase family protein [Methylovirgula sp.]
MLYFAYGSNMDRAAMHRRCPNSRALGRARLARHRLFIAAPGYVSIKTDPRADVHGVLYDLALSDVAALDRYEEVGRGLY